MTKEKIWELFHLGLIEVASNMMREDWLALFQDDEEAVDATMDSTGKHKAQTLLAIYSPEALQEMVIIDEDDEVHYDSISYKEVGIHHDRYDYVELWDSEEFLGYIKVYIDSGKIDEGIAESESTYICVNHEIMYLDNLTELNPED